MSLASVNRRVFLGGALLTGSAILTACTSIKPENTVPASPAEIPGMPTPSAGTTTPSTTCSASRVLLAYFSRTGENYHYGGRITLEVGNTQVVADMISAAIAVDV